MSKGKLRFTLKTGKRPEERNVFVECWGMQSPQWPLVATVSSAIYWLSQIMEPCVCERERNGQLCELSGDWRGERLSWWLPDDISSFTGVTARMGLWLRNQRPLTTSCLASPFQTPCPLSLSHTHTSVLGTLLKMAVPKTWLSDTQAHTSTGPDCFYVTWTNL